MNATTREKILTIFRQQSGFATSRDITAVGLHHKYLKDLLEDGTIIKLKHGLYSLSENDQYNSLKEAQVSIPDGIICLGTALAYYDLTTWIASEIHIAIPRGRKIKLPEFPPIQLSSFSGVFYSLGIVSVEVEPGINIQIYDREKTICDIVRFRNRIGFDIMKEALQEYVYCKERNLNKLVSYGKDLRISSVLMKYLEILI